MSDLKDIENAVKNLTFSREGNSRLYTPKEGSTIVPAAVGGVLGTGAGVGSGTALISSAGTVAGLSGPGIASGLAAIGGTMVGGIALVSCGTVALAGLGAWGGYHLYKKLGR